MKGRVRIMITIRNRLAITKYCLEHLLQNSEGWKLEIFLYDNLSNLDIKERFKYYSELIERRVISQFTFNTKQSTFNAFGKAVANNQFADFHMSSLNKDKIKYLVILDNDMLVFKRWLDEFDRAWQDIDSQSGLKNKIFVVTQNPGGVMHREPLKINGRDYFKGTSGGSGAWILKNNFYDRVGKLNLNQLIGKNKRHDQLYWFQIQNKTKSTKYVVTIPCKKILHLGGICGSICNVLERGENVKKIENNFEKIRGMSPEEIANRYPKFFKW